MSVSVNAYVIEGNRRSRTICEAMLQGARRNGMRIKMISESAFTSACSDIAVFYGMSGRLPRVMKDYKKVVPLPSISIWDIGDGGTVGAWLDITKFL